MRHIILGTAGHIDHGKSYLVKALTGIDPDRLKEEKERGITIDLGFAYLSYPDGLTIGIVDVPGHERLVKNMLAGAGGIDLVLLVIAADEGIMPQSREHLSICNLLKIKSGLIAITKTDLVEQEWLELLEDDIQKFVAGTFLEGSAIVPVSSKTMHNIDLLKEKIRDVALQLEPKPMRGLFRLPIDRVFTLKGFGTVVTGTAISGNLSLDEAVEILPSNIRTKVRGLHSHGKAMQTAHAGQRVAINLLGVDKDILKRGDAIVAPARFTSTKLIDATIELLPDAPLLKSKGLVHLHIGTSEITARTILYGQELLKAGQRCYCQFRLQKPVIAMSGDRYIIRRFSPVVTIGGGDILDPSAHRRSRKEGMDDLKIYETGTLSEKIETKVKKAGTSGVRIPFIEGWIKAEIPSITDTIKELVNHGTLILFDDLLFHTQPFDSLKDTVRKTLQTFHKKNPIKPGMSKEELRAQLNMDQRIFNKMITTMQEVASDKDLIRLKTFNAALSRADETLKKRILDTLEHAKYQPPSKEELAHTLNLDSKHITDILRLMVREGSLVRINDSLYITSVVYKAMIHALKNFFSKKSEMTVAEFRDVLQTSRKYALPFLEYLDANKMTVRVGDIRKSLLK
jgi:selenocysteine-specific elongation factor